MLKSLTEEQRFNMSKGAQGHWVMILARSDICQVKCQEQGITDDRKGLELGNSKRPRKLSCGFE